jgi:hypothetical protein
MPALRFFLGRTLQQFKRVGRSIEACPQRVPIISKAMPRMRNLSFGVGFSIIVPESIRSPTGPALPLQGNRMNTRFLAAI